MGDNTFAEKRSDIKDIKEDDSLGDHSDLYEENIPDIADEEGEDHIELLDEISNLAESMKMNIAQAYILFGLQDKKYNEIAVSISSRVEQMDLNSLMILKENILKNKKEKDSSTQPEPKQENKLKTLIVIRKGLQEREIKEYIKDIHKNLTDKPAKYVDIQCPEWEDNDHSTHPFLVKSCKKLLAKYCEMGLLGLLINHEIQESAHRLYCCAYVKGKLVEDKIHFNQVDINDYKIKTAESLKKFWMLIDGLDEENS